MKVVRIAGVLALLAMFTSQLSLAQSSDSQAQQQPQTQTQQTQQQQSPLQDQPTGIAAEQQAQQNQQRSGQLTRFETPTATQQDQELGEIRMMSRYTEIGGDTTRSFLDPGLNDLAEFNYFMDRRFLVTHRVQTLAMFRATDDYSIDPEKISLQKVFVRFYSPKDEYIFGDALVNYSRLTFNQNIRGGVASWLLSDNWKLSIAAGTFIDRWGSYYKDLPGRPYVSALGGARLAYSPNRNVTVGFNFSASSDILSTLPYTPVGTVPTPASNEVASVDLKVQQKNFRVNGEFAFARSNFDIRDDSNLCQDASGNLVTCNDQLPQPTAGPQSDWGAQVEASYRKQKFNLRASFVRFQPNFFATNARQISDLEDMLVRPGYDLTDWLSVDGTMRYSINDLSNQLLYRTTLWGPEGRFLFHDLPFYRRMVLEVGYRDRMVYSGNYSEPPSQTGTVDRYVRGPYAEVTVPVSTTFLTIGYERLGTVDNVNASQTYNTNRFYAGLRGVYDWRGWHINPSVRWELEHQGGMPFQDLTPPLYTFEYDSNRLNTVNLIVEAPKWFILEGGFRSASATLTGATSVPELYYPNGYSRPSYRAQVTYKVKNDENMLVIFSFERNSNFFYTSPNFDERVEGVTLVYKFGKRGR